MLFPPQFILIFLMISVIIFATVHMKITIKYYIYCSSTPINYQRMHTKHLASSCWLFCWEFLRNTQKRVFIELFFQSSVERLMEGHEFFAVLQVSLVLPQHIFDYLTFSEWHDQQRFLWVSEGSILGKVF